MRKLNRVSSVSINLIRQLHNNNVIKVGIVDVPFDKGQEKRGVGDGPRLIRQGGLIERLIGCYANNIDIRDYGIVQFKPDLAENTEVTNMRHYRDVVSCAKALSSQVEEIITSGRICLTLGGDHSIGIGTVHGHLKAKSNDVAVLWIDAHADINTNETSDSGNMHGMPLALLAKELVPYWETLPGMEWFQPSLSLKNIAYIGLRSVDPYEHMIMKKLGIASFNMFDIQKKGIDNVVALALAHIDKDAKKSIHVSFDIDSLDPLEAPSTGTAVRGGLLLREGIHIMATVHKTGRLGGMDMVEVNPLIGTEQDVDKTVSAAIHVILAAFGHREPVTLGLPDLIPRNTKK